MHTHTQSRCLILQGTPGCGGELDYFKSVPCPVLSLNEPNRQQQESCALNVAYLSNWISKKKKIHGFTFCKLIICQLLTTFVTYCCKVTIKVPDSYKSDFNESFILVLWTDSLNLIYLFMNWLSVLYRRIWSCLDNIYGFMVLFGLLKPVLCKEQTETKHLWSFYFGRNPQEDLSASFCWQQIYKWFWRFWKGFCRTYRIGTCL